MKDEVPHSFYERNPETGNYIIEISLDRYADIFNEWDHATYGRRDMDPELAFFLEECSEEIPMQYGVDLVFYLPKRAKDLEKERIISEVIRHYYAFYAGVERRTLARAYKQQVNYALLAIGLLAVAYVINFLQETVFVSIAKEGLIIGSWVFLWGSISFFTFDRGKQIEKIKGYERLSKADIRFRYDE